MITSIKRNVIKNIIIFICAILLISIGIFLNIQAHTKIEEDVGLYNEAISIYNDVNLYYDAIEGYPVFPLENLLEAIELFQQAASLSDDNELRSLAMYNIGTAIGRDYLIFFQERAPELSLETAVNILMSSIRYNSNNENAKYNLECIEKLLARKQEQLTPSATSKGGDAGTEQVGEKGY